MQEEMFRAKIVELLSDLVDAVKSALPKNTKEEVQEELTPAQKTELVWKKLGVRSLESPKQEDKGE